MSQTIQEEGGLPMRQNGAVHADTDRLLEALAAELTAAAYAVALRHRAAETWLDLQLELWQVLTETTKTRFGISD